MKRVAQLDPEAAPIGPALGGRAVARAGPLADGPPEQSLSAGNHSAVIETTDCRGRWPSVRRCPNRGVRRRRDPNTPSEPETVIRHNSYKSGSCRRTHTPGNSNTMDCRRC